ncbi:MAG: MobA/MobL family protein [Eubacteriales bacterium]|nr:MobA/MobL family protein [Eubacteriales bacterium]
MGRHSFIRQFKLRDVRGRVDYISNPKRQEYLYASYSTVEPEFWKYLAEQNQYDFKRSRARGECIEARELVIALPESLQEYSPEELLKLFTEQFRTKYGVQCTAALHHNKTKTNYHIHLIYSERKLLEKPERKVATRNMFYDEQGRHVRTKKEILAEDGKTMRSGCRVIPKGEIYEMNFFDAKEDGFKGRDFLIAVKEMYTDLINKLVREETEKLTVFDPTGPYLATKKIGKTIRRKRSSKQIMQPDRNGTVRWMKHWCRECHQRKSRK